MRALTVRQPWAGAIAAPGGKRVENRTWATRYRGPLAIHAGLRWDPGAEHDPAIVCEWSLLRGPGDPDRPPSDAPVFAVRGAVVVVAYLVDCHFSEAGCCEPWGSERQYHWMLDDVRPLSHPVPARGALGLWRPSQHVIDGVEAALL